MFKRHRTKEPRSEPIDSELTTKGIYGLESCHDDGALAIADVVFVHGLTGNRRSTWTDKRSNVFWPKDLLGNDGLPPTRILSYGYDADIAHFWALASQNRISEHAGNLVNALAQLRSRSDTEGRPIIFVTHSLGGLVTEDAILFSKNSAELYLQDIFHSVSGVCFLGTPHCGSDLAQWASIAASLVKAVKTANVSLVKTLKPNSEVLARVQREFQNMHRTLPRDRAFGITCFFEELHVRGIGEIVPKHSAILPSYNAIGIRANHMDMSKYSSVRDPGYEAVSGEIRRWLKAIKNQRDAEKLVCDAPIPIDDSSSQSRGPSYTDRTLPIINDPLYPSPHSYADNHTQSYVSHEPVHHSESPQPYSYPNANNYTSQYVPNEPAQPHLYAHSDNRTQNYIPNESTYNLSHTQTPSRGTYFNGYAQNHVPSESARHFSPTYTDHHTQHNNPNEATYPFPHTYSPNYTQNNSSPSREEREQRSVTYGGGSNSGVNNGGVNNSGVVYGGIRNGGMTFRDVRNDGTMPQMLGSFNVGGNINFG